MIIRGILPILDIGPLAPKERATEMAHALFDGGARALQLRAKSLSDRELLELARAVAAIARAHGADFYVNDRPDIAVLAEARGVHLGQEDLPAREVRAWLPPAMAIGISCHSVQDVERAMREGVANYLGYGPVFPTATKQNPSPVVGLGGLKEVVDKNPSTCFVAIGGITVERLAQVRAVGAPAAAMISGILSAPDLAARMREASRTFG